MLLLLIIKWIDIRWADPGGTAIPGQPVTEVLLTAIILQGGVI